MNDKCEMCNGEGVIFDATRRGLTKTVCPECDGDGLALGPVPWLYIGTLALIVATLVFLMTKVN